MRNSLTVTLLVLLFPALASAHAVPLESHPASSGTLDVPPTSVEIRFSERIDVEASRIRVVDPNGTDVSVGDPEIVGSDQYRIFVPISNSGPGAYVVEWSVVSRDDGHFTRGAYPFAVGEGVALPQGAESDVEIVQIATLPEIAGMTIELLGHGLLWAILVLFAFAVRPLMRAGKFMSETVSMRRLYQAASVGGALMVIAGGLYQIATKAADLAALHGSGLADAVPMYASTVAGNATVVRMLCALIFAILALAFAGRITRSLKLTWQEGVLLSILAIFAFMRAKVSHATANHFLPDLSLAVNFVHLIDKDIWAGLVILLSCFLLIPALRSMFSDVLPRVFAMLTVNFGVISATASYIIWLHLKDWSNLQTTQWGTSLLELAFVAVLLAAARAYHVASRALWPRIFKRMLSYTIGAELVLSIAVIYLSSAVIITSPPPEEPPMPRYAVSSEGVRIDMSRYAYQDGMVGVRVSGGTPAGDPSVSVRRAGSEFEIDLVEVYPGLYVFPAAVFGEEEARVAVRVPQEHAYDASATFSVPVGAYDDDAYAPGDRAFDAFTASMIALALAGAALFALLLRTSRPRMDDEMPRHRYADIALIAGSALTALFVVGGLAALRSSGLQNPYRAACEKDGNMWHVMLPMWAGQPRSLTPREGCMWGMGRYQYMFPERAEYDHYASLPASVVRVDFARDPVAGVPVEFVVSIQQQDGSPAPLFLDMEKLVHVVLVSKDQTQFAHIHPDDSRALTDEEVRTSTFRLEHTFPKAGEYLLSIDYANGITLRSSQVVVSVAGSPQQSERSAIYESPAAVGGFTVALDYAQPLAGEVSTLVYDIRKDGAPAELEPYLSAAMHIAVVKNDLTAFAHTHGEVHPPGAVLPPVVVRDGKIVHTMAAMTTPARFSYPVDAHVIFPVPGVYTVWGQFQSAGVVYAVPFSVRVE